MKKHLIKGYPGKSFVKIEMFQQSKPKVIYQFQFLNRFNDFFAAFKMKSYPPFKLLSRKRRNKEAFIFRLKEEPIMF
jgi:hypothetical protein